MTKKKKKITQGLLYNFLRVAVCIKGHKLKYDLTNPELTATLTEE